MKTPRKAPAWLPQASADARRRPGKRGKKRQEGVALIMVTLTVAILAILLADLQRTTVTGALVAAGSRDALQAEYTARSALNLTRFMVSQEPAIRGAVAPIYQGFIGRPPPQLPVWEYANALLSPFCPSPDSLLMDEFEDEEDEEDDDGKALFGNGIGEMPGTCEIIAVAENAKVNVSDPLNRDGNRARRSIAMQLFALMGGYQSPSPYDAIFGNRDADGQFTSRLDVVSALIDWWDIDTTRTVFDPGAATVEQQGGEDDFYGRLDDPYEAKNAPFDSLEEVRLVRGVGDDFWATFIEPRPDDPRARTITIYGSGLVNPNEAPPAVILARVCSFLEGAPLCTDPAEAAKFIQILNTARSMFPVPFFNHSRVFLDFLEGRGGPQDLYPMLRGFLGEGSELLFTPLQIPSEVRGEIERSFVVAARIITIQATGRVGNARVRVSAVMNFHDRWTPPPPNTGTVPPLGIFHHYRVD